MVCMHVCPHATIAMFTCFPMSFPWESNRKKHRCKKLLLLLSAPAPVSSDDYVYGVQIALLKEEGEQKLEKLPREIFESFQIYVRLFLSESVTCSLSTKGDHKQQLWSIFLTTNCSYRIRSNLHGCREGTPCNSKFIICLETAMGERSLKLSLN